MICNACSGINFKQFATRDDGLEIRQCAACGLGVVATLPDGTDQYYGDDYYLGGGCSGYEDYQFMAEHGLGWAAALVQLLAKGCRILDIGCADGFLLNKLPAAFEKFGIEVNEKAATQAMTLGVHILGRDLLAPNLAESYRAKFDVVTSIAVFEHLLDFRGGFKAAMSMIKDDGFLLFEVPVMSSTASNSAWLQGSFEHIYYPTEASIRYIINAEPDFQLIGSEVQIKDYASTYIGIVTKNQDRATEVKAVFERLMQTDFVHAAPAELRAATHLHLMHAGQASSASIRLLTSLDANEFSLPLVARIAQLWSFDLERMRKATGRALQAEATVAAREREKSDGELRLAHSHLKEKHALEAWQKEMQRAADLEAMVAHLRVLLSVRESRAKESEQLAAEAVKQRDAIEQSLAWRATGPVRRLGSRYPAVARRVRQAVKLVGWTLRGTALIRIRESAQRRAHAKRLVLTEAEAKAADEAASRVALLPRACVLDGVVDQPEGAEWPADRPLVSIVIPCFNYGHLVAEAIASAQAQTFSDLEIIVVEGGSTSAESRQKLLEATAKSSARLRVLIQHKPHRAGANRNFGISHALGKYVCCLDADDRLAPTYIEKAIFMLEYSGYDVISPALQLFGTRSEVWAPREQPTLDMILEENNALTCAVFPRAYWLKAGGYRDSDRATGHLHEDWLFWTRLAALGARFLCIREPLFYYRSHPGTLSNAHDVLDHQVQKRLVARFNADVLTDEALNSARTKSLSPPPRPPRPLESRPVALRSGEHVGPVLLLAMPFLVLGGAERLLSAVVVQLAKKGWRVIIVTTVAVGPEHGDTTSWFEPATAEIFHLPRFLDQTYWRDFIDHLFATRNVQLLWVIGSAFVYDQLPFLKLMHADLKVADLLFNTVGHTSNNRRYADCIDLTFVENREVKQWLLDVGETLERISLVESGVDLQTFRPRNQDAAVSELTDIPNDAVLIGFFGRWSDEKDPLGFIEIARRSSKHLNIVFLMTGAGPLEDEVRKAVVLASFEPGRFLLKGSVPDLVPYLQACDILCLPSRLDGRPNVVMEALATGTAVIASSVGALPEMVEDGRQGFLCEPGAYDAFATRIDELAADPERLRRFQAEARVHAECRFNICSMLDRYESELGGLIQCSK